MTKQWPGKKRAELRPFDYANYCTPEHHYRFGSRKIYRLQQDFRDMAGMLTSIMEQIGKAVARIASASKKLKAIAEQSAQGAGQVAAAGSQVAIGAMERSRAVDDTVQTVQAIGEEIYGIVKHASAVGDVSQHRPQWPQREEKHSFMP